MKARELTLKCQVLAVQVLLQTPWQHCIFYFISTRDSVLFIEASKVLKTQEPDTGYDSRRSLFARMGSWIHRHRGVTISLWGMLVVLSLTLTPHLEQSLQGAGMTYEAGEARQTERFLQQELKLAQDPLVVVFQSSESRSGKQTQADVERLLNQIRQLPAVDSVIGAGDRPEYRSRDGQTYYSVINLNQSGSDTIPAIAQIEQLLSQSAPAGLNTFVTGKAVVDRDAQQISKVDLQRAELFALPLTLIALLFVFGSVVAAAMPVAMGAMTVSVTYGLLYFVAQRMHFSSLALNFTSMLGLGLGIDYSLLIVNRFREEIQTGSVPQAIARTVNTAGRAVFVSGITVCISLVCLLLFPISLLRSIGIAGSFVVFLSVAAALTVLPALLSLVGKRINWGSRVVRSGAPSPRRLWSAIARTVIRHSVVALAVVLMLVAFLSSPFLRANFGLGDASILPKSVPARTGVEVVEQAFGPGEITPILLALRTQSPEDSILSAPHIATLYSLVRKLQADPRIARVNSLVNIVPQLGLKDYQQLYQTPTSLLPETIRQAVNTLSRRSTTLVMITSRTVSHDAASHNLVRDLRALSLEGLKIQVGGQAASEIDTLQEVSQQFPLILAATMLITFVVLCFLFQSWVLPLKAIAMNFLSIGASFGALVFIFQEGHFQNWLNFTPLGYLDILLPLVLFCVVFGLSMDYEVFLLTRIKEIYDDCGDNSRSVVEGLERTGWIITSAALLLIIVTGAFTLTNIIFMKALGLGIALAILIDATLIRIVLVPATMHLMGKWNWWSPRFFRRGQTKRR